ncbi:DUF4062 domain-containing protein (plasmid) [Mycolicibacterium aichiense]|uniref:DUF4062 domain-containing protein n=1 Tax=Mycolicibacterium aichiense TaxID=1799 RepID=UPI003D670A4D
MATVPIFLSSTFQDFHVERDLIRHQVLPALNATLRPHGVTVDFVDLRWGIDTSSAEDEQQANARIIDVCLREIERCRPLFVGLVGDRYGWVPPATNIRDSVKAMGLDPETLPACEVGLSITALEIWFGVMCSTNPAVVCLRQRSLPDTMKTAEDKGISWLRDELVDLAVREPTRVTTLSYPPERDAQSGQPHRSAFAERLLRALEPMVLARAVEYARAGASSYEVAATLTRQSGSTVFVGRDQLRSSVIEEIASGSGRGMVIHGPSGIGKTAMLVSTIEELDAAGYSIATAFVGAGYESSGATDVIKILAAQLALEFPAGLTRDNEVADWWTTAFARLPAQTLIVVDALDQLEAGDCRSQLPMLRAVLNDCPATVLVTTTMPEQVALLESWGLRSRALDELEPRDVRVAALQWVAAAGRRTLPPAVVDILASRPRAPIWIRLAIGELIGITRESYQFAESLAQSGVEPAESVSIMLMDEARSLPPDSGLLSQRTLRRVVAEFEHESQGHAFLAALAVSRSGLTPSSLERIAEATTLDVTRAIWQLGSEVMVRDGQGRILLVHSVVKEAAIAMCDAELHLVHDAIAKSLDPASCDATEQLDRLWHCLHVPDAASQAQSLLNLPPYAVCRPVLRELSTNPTRPWSTEHVDHIIGTVPWDLDLIEYRDHDMESLVRAVWDLYLGQLSEWLASWLTWVGAAGDSADPRLRAWTAMADASWIQRHLNNEWPWQSFAAHSEPSDYPSVAAKLEHALDAISPMLISANERERALAREIGAMTAALFPAATVLEPGDSRDLMQAAIEQQKLAMAKGFTTRKESDAMRAARLLDEGKDAEAYELGVRLLEAARRVHLERPDPEVAHYLRALHCLVAESNAFLGRTQAAFDGWLSALALDARESLYDEVSASVARWTLQRNPQLADFAAANDEDDDAFSALRPPRVDDVTQMMTRCRLALTAFDGCEAADDLRASLEWTLLKLSRAARGWSKGDDQQRSSWLKVATEAQVLWAAWNPASFWSDADSVSNKLAASRELAASLIDIEDADATFAVCQRAVELARQFLKSSQTTEEDRLDATLRRRLVHLYFLRAATADELAPKRARWRARTPQAKAAWHELKLELELHQAMGWMDSITRKWLATAEIRSG